jgi:membrane protein YqaA with SNARE-associated domain
VSLIFGTFLFSIASALIPILNLEIYLGALPNAQNRAFELALVAAAGQTLGKVVWYYAGVHSMKLPWLRRKMEAEKWQESYQKWHDRIFGRPLLAGTIVFASAVSGFPPLAVVAVLAGSMEMNFLLFLGTVMAGRFVRFWLVLEGAEWVRQLAPHLFGYH